MSIIIRFVTFLRYWIEYTHCCRFSLILSLSPTETSRHQIHGFVALVDLSPRHGMQSIVAHLDMDAFYASAEMIRRPELKGLPVVVGGPSQLQPLKGHRFPILRQYQGRGVLTTANYEARKLGLHSAMPTMKAAKLAPDAVLLPVDFPWYKHLSAQFKEAVRAICPLIENRGIDEIYLDLTVLTQGSFDEALQVAKALKAAVVEATGGMTCSIGLSANKLTSKICSDLNKPDGITLVRPEEFEQVIWPMSVGKINGIGPKAKAKLHAMRVDTIAELAQVELSLLLEQFGQNYGLWLFQSARGIDNRPVVLESAPKSISRETTFGSDLHLVRNRKDLTESLIHLCQKLSVDLQRKQVQARTVGIKVRFPDFRACTRDHTPGGLINSPEQLLEAARYCLKKVGFGQGNTPSLVRLLGVRASGLVDTEQATLSQQLDLF